jgi:hypothetical protein
MRLPSASRLLYEYLHQSRSPLDLAIARMVIFGILAWLCVGRSPTWMAGLPRELLFPPPLTQWLTALPIEPRAVQVAQIVTVLGSLAAALGLGYRLTAPLAVVGSLYVLGIPQLWGKVNHYHHIVWFAAILAFSPATDALVPGRRTLPRPSPAYGRPLAFIGLLIGLNYLFPGLAKAGVGLPWIWSDNLKYLLYQKWFQLPGFQPLLALDQYPLVLRLLAASVVLFELSFVWLILHPRTRPLAVVGGLAFHAGSALIMGINFWTIWACYVVFVPWGRLASYAGAPSPERRGPILVGWLCITGAALAFLFRINSWPFGYYPTFARLAGPSVTLVHAENLDPAIERRIMARMSGTRWHSILRRAATHPDPVVRARTARGILTLLQREDPNQEALRLTIVTRNVVPQNSPD